MCGSAKVPEVAGGGGGLQKEKAKTVLSPSLWSAAPWFQHVLPGACTAAHIKPMP